MASKVIPPAQTDDGGTRSAATNGNGATLSASQPSKQQQHQQQSPSLASPEASPLFSDDDAAASDASASDEESSSSANPVTSPVTPPYWLQGQTQAHAQVGRDEGRGSRGGRHALESGIFGGTGGRGRGGGSGGGLAVHGRSVSNVSTESVVPAGAITLQDNETADGDDGPGRALGRDRNRACWAKSVSVTDHVVVNGSATNIGAFVVWNIRVETLSGSHMNIRKRYSEFDELRQRLIYTFPNFEAAVPVLPPKSVISKFRPNFLEKRRSGLQYFLNCILLNPEFSGSPVLKDFLFS